VDKPLVEELRAAKLIYPNLGPDLACCLLCGGATFGGRCVMVRALTCAERIELLVTALASERHYRRALLEELRDELAAFRHRNALGSPAAPPISEDVLAAAERLTALEQSALS
jgi:hypothetical protein